MLTNPPEEARKTVMTARLMRFMFALVMGVAVVVAGCGTGDDADMDTDPTMTDTMMADTAGVGDMQDRATAQLQSTEGNNVIGTVTFTSENGAVRVEADVSGLAPGEHGFHVHEFGDCSAPDASSAGDHFNPTNEDHGAPDDSVRHVGDLGNLEAGQDSTASYSQVDSVITLSGQNSIVDKAVVVHADADDLESQPSGNAGDRLACGVIEQNGGMGTPGGTVVPGGNDMPGGDTAAARNTEI